MKNKLFTICLAVILSLGLISCGTGKVAKDESKNNKINVTVSFYPLKDFTEEIGGDKVNVQTLIPNNMEPHDYEPKTKDFEKLMKSDLFIYSGLGLESWVDKVNETLNGQDVAIVNSSKGINAIKLSEESEENNTSGTDPHIWLSLKNAKIQCENIKNALVKADPNNKQYYEDNCKKYQQKLSDLNAKYEEKFKEMPHKDFITGHAAFGYLCRDYNLEQKSVENVFGEGEPTPKQLEELVNYCKQKNIKTIFSESLASPKVSQTLASEVNAKVVPIYTLESQEDNKNYLQAMEYNLENIYNCLKQE